MARNPYVITVKDRSAGENYISRKLHEETLFDNDEYYPSARRSFSKARADAEKLNRWCENHLNSEQWIQLKNAIRAARKRKNDQTGTNQPPATITISRDAWTVLSDLSKHHGLTLSEFIIKKHEKAWLKLWD